MTKIHLNSDIDGHPLRFYLIACEAGESPEFGQLLDIGPDVTPRADLADKGYDDNTSKAAARARGISPAIPVKSNARDRQAFFPKALYCGRARIQQCFGELKRIALRCRKTAKKIVALAFGFILVRSVYTASVGLAQFQRRDC